MIKLFSLKQQKKDGTDPNGKSGMGQKKSSAAQLRITKGDFSESTLSIPNPEQITKDQKKDVARLRDSSVSEYLCIYDNNGVHQIFSPSFGLFKAEQCKSKLVLRDYILVTQCATRGD